MQRLQRSVMLGKPQDPTGIWKKSWNSQKTSTKHRKECDRHPSCTGETQAGTQNKTRTWLV